MKFFFLIFLFSFNCFAQTNCKQPVTYITQNTPASCTGYLFSPEEELSVRTKVASYDSLNEIIQKQTQLVSLMSDRNTQLSDQLDSQQRNNMLQNAGYFLLGVIFTGAIAHYAH